MSIKPPSKIIKFDKLTGKLERATLLLKTRTGEFIDRLNYSNLNISFVGKGVDEISFDVHKSLNGKECKSWDKIIDLCIIDYVGYGLFEASVSLKDEREAIKTVTAKSLEIELGQRTLRDFHVNDEDAFTYPRKVDLDNKGNFIPTVLYDKNDVEHSLINRVLKEKCPHWKVGYVSPLFNVNGRVYPCDILQRTFTVSGKSVYDFFDSDVSSECGCIFTYDTYNRLVNCYNLESCVYKKSTMEVIEGAYRDLDTGLYVNKDGTQLSSQSNYAYCDGIGEDTTILISKNKLSKTLMLDSDKDSIKNCFYVGGGDDVMTNMFAVANVTGDNYIIIFDKFQYDDMPETMRQKITNYQTLLESSSESFYAEGGVYVYDSTCTYDVNTDTCRDANNKILPTAIYQNSKVYVLDQCAYYKNGAGYDADGNKLTDYIYKDTAGLYFQYLQLQDRYNYLNNTKLPNVSLEETSASKEMSELKTYFNTEYVLIRNSCSATSFAHVTGNIEDIIGTVVDARYNYEILSGDDYPKTCTAVNTTTTSGTWTGYVKITNEIDTTESSISKITVKIKRTSSTTEEINYCKQKMNLAIAKMSIADMEFPDGEITAAMEQELLDIFSQYNLTRLKSYYSAFDSCLVTLEDLYKQLDSNDTTVSQSYTKTKELYSLRKSTCKQVLDKIQKMVNDVKGQLTRVQNEIDEFRSNLNMQNYFDDEELWNQFQAYIREDEYSNQNYVSDGLSDSELLEKAKELKDVATKELSQACVIQYKVSGDINNIFSQKELFVLYDKFALFNYVRCKLDNHIYKLRLISISFSDNSPEVLNVTFSEMIEDVTDYISDTKKILESAQSMSTSYSSTQKQSKQGASALSTFNQLKNDGLNSAEYIIKNSNAEVIQDNNGLLFRMMTDSGIYANYQTRITPNGMYLTSNNWQSYGMAVGTVILSGETYFGVIADALVGDMIVGESLNINNKNGSVSITGDGINIKNGVIQSANYKANSSGSLLNLSDGTFDYAGGKLTYSNSTLKVEGDIVAKNLTATESGKIANFNISSNALYTDEATFSNTTGLYFGSSGLRLGSNFKVTSGGVITATSGKIANFNFNTNSLYTDDAEYGKTGLYFGSSGLSLGSNFKVTASGNVTANGSLTANGTLSIANGNLTYNSTNGLKVKGNIEATSGTFSGNITSSATITGGILQSTNYSSTEGMKINLNEGTLNSANLQISKTGIITCTGIKCNYAVRVVEEESGSWAQFAIKKGNLEYSIYSSESTIIKKTYIENATYVTLESTDECHLAFGTTNITNLYANNTTSERMYCVRLDSVGNIYAGGFLASRGAMEGETYTDTSAIGIRTTAGAIVKTSGSAKRFKHDVTTELSNELNPHKLYDINLYQYKYNDGYLSKQDIRYGKDVIGFIAEDVYEKYSIAADYSYDDNGNIIINDWNYRFMIPAMLKLIQEQNDRLRKLEENE